MASGNQRGTQLFTQKDFEPVVPWKRRSPRNRNEPITIAYSNPEFGGTEDNNKRSTTKEVRQLIHSLKEIITHQTTVIESTKVEILEVKHDQKFLQYQNERLHTLPQKHPIWNTLLRVQRRRNNLGSYARLPLAEALKAMNLERLWQIEMVDPTPLPPWRQEVSSKIETGRPQ